MLKQHSRFLPSPSVSLGAFALILIGLLWSLVIERVQLEYTHAVALADATGAALADAYAQHAERVFKQVDQVSRFLKMGIEADPDPAHISRLLNESRDSLPEFSLLYSVANESGTIIASTVPAASVSIADRAHFRVHRAFDSGRLFIGGVVLGRVSHVWSVQTSRRLNKADGSFAGVVVISIAPKSLINLADAHSAGAHALVGLVGDDGAMRALEVGEDDVKDDASDGAPIGAMLARATSANFVAQTPGDDIERRFAVRRIADFPIAAVVGIDLDDHLADYHRHRTTYIAVGLIGTLMILVFMLLLIGQTRALSRTQALAKEAERDYRAASEGSMDSFLILESVFDEAGTEIIDFKCRNANQRAADALGRTREELLGKRMLRDFPERVSRTSFKAYVRAATSPKTIEEDIHMMVRGKPKWIRRQVVPIDGGIALTSRDITAAKLAELALKESEARLRLIADNMPALIARLDCDLCFTFVNQTHAAWFGVECDSLIGQPLQSFYGRRVFRQVSSHVDTVLKGRAVDFERSIPTLAGERQVQVRGVPDLDSYGNVRGIFVLMNDITALKQAEARLWALAQVDALTGIANRHQFNERLDATFKRARASASNFALIFLDIDRFKEINDTLGHDCGDEVLREFARRLETSIRSDDVVARLGGDEFVIILHSVRAADEVLFLTRKIQHRLTAAFQVRGATLLKVTASMGVALLRPSDVKASELLRRADEALYQAKAAGRDTCKVVA